MIILPTAATALILIDLQKGIVGSPLAPYSGEVVLAKGKELARRFRAAKAPVALVNVAFPDFGDALKNARRPAAATAVRRLSGRLDRTGGRPCRTLRPAGHQAPVGRVLRHGLGPAAPPAGA